MTPELRRKWVEALESGKYKQGNANLLKYGFDSETGKTDFEAPRYCCLGVLCDVLGKNTRNASDGDELLSDETLKEVGLTQKQQSKLSSMNDGSVYEGMKIKRHTFGEIAKYILHNLETW